MIISRNVCGIYHLKINKVKPSQTNFQKFYFNQNESLSKLNLIEVRNGTILYFKIY